MFYDRTKKQVGFKVSVMCAMDEIYEGNGLRLKRIVINLLGNMVKFTGTGGQSDLFIAEGEKGRYIGGVDI